MPNHNPRNPVTLEDLLRLKRAERPSPEFWTRFESELRRKQLAALLEVRPWWQTLPHFLGQRRIQFPLGAAALVAIALASPRFFVSERSAGETDRIADQITETSQVRLAATPAPTIPETTPVSPPVAVADYEAQQSPAAAVAVSLSEHLPEHAMELTPWNAPIPVRTPVAQLFAANGEQFERDDSRLARSLSSNSTPIVSRPPQSSGGAVAELASVSAMASKRSRLLAQFGDRQFAPEPQAPASVRERLTRRLADSSFTEHFTRIGLKGDQVSLRF